MPATPPAPAPVVPVSAPIPDTYRRVNRVGVRAWQLTSCEIAYWLIEQIAASSGQHATLTYSTTDLVPHVLIHHRDAHGQTRADGAGRGDWVVEGVDGFYALSAASWAAAGYESDLEWTDQTTGDCLPVDPITWSPLDPTTGEPLAV